MAFPRRVYTQSHVDYLAEVMLYVNSIKDDIRGVRIVDRHRCCATSPPKWP
jgi:tryptophanase